jgi:alanyl-tRNA synthetase
VSIGDFSRELCGGTHTVRSGQIGLVKIVSERGVASGVRRVEATSGEGSLDRFREEHAIVRALEEQLSAPREKVVAEIERRLEQLRSLQRDLERRRLDALREKLDREAAAPPRVGGVPLLARRVDGISPQEMRELADGLRRKLGSGVVVLGRSDAGKGSLLVAVSPDLADRFSAVEIVRELGHIIGGGGGGRPELAEAGGKLGEKVDEALGAATGVIERRTGGRG